MLYHIGLSHTNISVIGGLEKAVCDIINPAKQERKEGLEVTFSNESSSSIYKTGLVSNLGRGQHIFIYAKGQMVLASASC